MNIFILLDRTREPLGAAWTSEKNSGSRDWKDHQGFWVLHIYLMVTQVPSLCALFCKYVSLPFKVKQKRNKHENNKCTFRVAPRQVEEGGRVASEG